MTAQVEDRLRFRNNDYSVVAISRPIQFNPKDYGITPEGSCSACWAGYWCEYQISESEIILENLYINSQGNNYPSINGILPLVEKNNKGKRVDYMGHHLYKGINIPVHYSGKIVAGKDFMNEYYIHMGFQRAWAYKVLKEFVFEAGSLREVNDHSKTVEKLREEIDKQPQEFKRKLSENIDSFVEESFSLSMESKAWWIKNP